MDSSARQEEQQQQPHLSVFYGDLSDAEPEDDLDRAEDDRRDEVEAFWAGRNHAMRRSARVAA